MGGEEEGLIEQREKRNGIHSLGSSYNRSIGFSKMVVKLGGLKVTGS